MKNFVLDNDEISVTELEIQYGLWLNQKQLDKIIFCIRESKNIHFLPEDERSFYTNENDMDTQKMGMLKQKILSTPGTHVLHYSLDFSNEKNLYDEFSSKLTSMLNEILLQEWGSKNRISWIEQEEDT